MGLHCSINTCFRLLTAGWYIAANGKILSLAFFFCARADGLEAKLKGSSYDFFWIAASSQALFEFHKALID